MASWWVLLAFLASGASFLLTVRRTHVRGVAPAGQQGEWG